ncbi:hypothetical protein Psal006b_01010 [Piscirickettsia salmonis]|uniref:Divergent AAA domain protein n=1 Tax=Piscirickettsia salmonis TaxID=1238 RepID=A0A1L6TD86_PISSA|nr:hypothetical protein [Piscirickettsia salmonis]ALT18565.1 hypothetical protein PSLF89_06855 [Piscirickettsia salmonis LF-89 = ATCC VR-1361]ALB23373.1 divergent AAA domain protein [Piscirickettsia salmonis]ALY03264.1 hypothetical protein AWE47_10760 [Piscirickettsia salmonis]AMA42831.1 hypothetical protein AWJ11_10985 [Piscirickettsia salmonis]AOS35299.1 hypothetical protein AVM72_08115 [Piscirickettsia salmonis]
MIREPILKTVILTFKGKLLAEGWVYDSKTLIEVDLAGELKPEWYEEELKCKTPDVIRLSDHIWSFTNESIE